MIGWPKGTIVENTRYRPDFYLSLAGNAASKIQACTLPRCVPPIPIAPNSPYATTRLPWLAVIGSGSAKDTKPKAFAT
jgi:hypothetical protein